MPCSVCMPKCRRQFSAQRDGMWEKKVAHRIDVLSYSPTSMLSFATIPQVFEAALQHHLAGRLAEAEGLYRQILGAKPDHFDALHHLGIIAHQMGQVDAAIAFLTRATTVQPDNPLAHNNMGEAYRMAGLPSQAMESYLRALCRLPNEPSIHNNLGIVLAQQGRLEEATAAFLRALQIQPDSAQFHNNLGNALKDRGQLPKAVEAYRRAISLSPAYPQAHHNLANALREQALIPEAVESYRMAIHLQPNYPEAYNGLGNAFMSQGRIDEAVKAYQCALEIWPDYAEACNNLGNAYRDCGNLDASLALFRRATELLPAHAGMHSNLICALHYHPSKDAWTLAEEQLRWNRRFTVPVRTSITPHNNVHAPGRRLRIGYVSPEFRDHVTGRYIHPLLTHHSHQSFEIACYAEVSQEDELTSEFRQYADRWRSTVGLTDALLSQIVRRDQVDILVDLTQHLAGNRLQTFALQPAPVQVSFAGYPESSGLETIHCRISDKWMEQDGVAQSDGTIVKVNGPEQVYFIDSFWCYDPCGLEVATNEPPAQEAGVITFGSLNNFCKVNEPLLKLWARVLGAVMNSRLIILSHEGTHRQRTLQFLEREGVEANRIEFATPRPRKEYLELYHRLDIVLDTFPYNGHTTSLDALWMGVPVVSLCGKRPVSRAGLSQLNNLGLPELVAFSDDQYVDIATRLANDIPRLKELRATLRQRMEKSVLMDGPHFARQIEACYRSMWRQWCESQTRSAQNRD